MEYAFVITVRFHEGRYHGAGDWPPAPARLFQALVASAAMGRKIPPAAFEGLEWLECLPPPEIAAPNFERGRRFMTYEPSNDLDIALSKESSDLETAQAKIRKAEKWHYPALFDPQIPFIYCWFIEGSEHPTDALCEAARNLHRLGRGHDMIWAEASVVDRKAAHDLIWDHQGRVYKPSRKAATLKHQLQLLCPRPKTMQSLITRYHEISNRLQRDDSKKEISFVQPPRPFLRKVTYNAPDQKLVFGIYKFHTLQQFESHSLASASTLITEVRDRAARRLTEASTRMTETKPSYAEDVERYLIGHGAGAEDKSARVRIAPIPSIGHRHVDMMIRRIAVYVPQSCPLSAADLSWAFEQANWVDDDGVIKSELRNIDGDRMVKRYEQSRRHWWSVTPLALPGARRRRIEPSRQADEAKDGTERAREEAGAVHAVRQALRHVGVTVAPTDIRVQREPFDDHGERAELFAAGTRFPKEALWHVSIFFAAPVDGPLVLGDGRYLGLGLMRPAEPKSGSGVLAFAIEDGLADSADSGLVARAARRAMMARVQSNLPRGVQVPPYVSGHDENGAAMRSGTHRHIAVAVDLPRRRFLYIAPNRLQHRGVLWSEVRGDHGLVGRALEGMDFLLAGKAGRLVVGPATVDAESDPLFAPNRVWESVTDYSVTRHRHRRQLTDKEALKVDALGELRRCGWPIPESVEVLATLRGPRGGLTGRLRITFGVAQKGPLLLGRTAHKGGGLFVGSI